MNSQFPIGVPSFIQKTLFGVGQIEFLEGGYLSDVILVSAGRKTIFKIVGGQNKEVQLTLSEATELGQKVSRYRRLLHAVGMPVPGFLEWFVTEQEDGQVYLVLSEPFSGTDFRKILRRGVPEARRMVVEEVIGNTSRLGSVDQPDGFLSLGLDPTAANFTLSPDGDCTYVDFMPPKYRTSDGQFPPTYWDMTEAGYELWKQNYFTLPGLMTVALSQLGRTCPESFQEIKETAFAVLRRGGNREVLEHLEGLTTPGTIEECTNPPQLRLMACELVSRQGGNTEDMRRITEEFFQRTHGVGELDSDTLRWARGRLIRMSAA